MSNLPPETTESDAEAKAAYERCHSRIGCAAKVDARCAERNDHAHHRKLRKHGGATTDANLLNVCHACHLHIHAFPAESYELGLLVPSWADPETWGVR